QNPPDRAQHWIAEILVEGRHRPIFDAASKTVPDDQIITRLELLYKGVKRSEIVACVRIAHNDELASRSVDSHTQRVSIAALRDGDNPRTERFSDLAGPIIASIVGDNDLAAEALSRDVCTRLGNADRQRPRFI